MRLPYVFSNNSPVRRMRCPNCGAEKMIVLSNPYERTECKVCGSSVVASAFSVKT